MSDKREKNDNRRMKHEYVEKALNTLTDVLVDNKWDCAPEVFNADSSTLLGIFRDVIEHLPIGILGQVNDYVSDMVQDRIDRAQGEGCHNNNKQEDV